MNPFDNPTDRCDALRCMAWAGTGALWAMSGGVTQSTMLGGNGVPVNPAASSPSCSSATARRRL
jgi:hypothetical protein